jgi:hypothetical protein
MSAHKIHKQQALRKILIHLLLKERHEQIPECGRHQRDPDGSVQRNQGYLHKPLSVLTTQARIILKHTSSIGEVDANVSAPGTFMLTSPFRIVPRLERLTRSRIRDSDSDDGSDEEEKDEDLHNWWRWWWWRVGWRGALSWLRKDTEK